LVKERRLNPWEVWRGSHWNNGRHKNHSFLVPRKTQKQWKKRPIGQYLQILRPPRDS